MAGASREGTEDAVEDGVELFADVFGEESQDEVAVLLEEVVLAAVTAVGLGAGEMVGTVEFDGEAGGFAEEVDFHAAGAVEGNGEVGVEAEAVRGGGKGLQAAKEEGFGGAAGPVGALGIRWHGSRHLCEQGCQWLVDAVPDQALHTGCVVALPLRIGGQRNVDRQPGTALAGRRTR